MILYLGAAFDWLNPRDVGKEKSFYEASWRMGSGATDDLRVVLSMIRRNEDPLKAYSASCVAETVLCMF